MENVIEKLTDEQMPEMTTAESEYVLFDEDVLVDFFPNAVTDSDMDYEFETWYDADDFG